MSQQGETFGSAYILKTHVSAELKVIWKFGLVSNFSTIFIFSWEKILDPRNNDTFKTVIQEPEKRESQRFFYGLSCTVCVETSFSTWLLSESKFLDGTRNDRER